MEAENHVEKTSPILLNVNHFRECCRCFMVLACVEPKCSEIVPNGHLLASFGMEHSHPRLCC